MIDEPYLLPINIPSYVDAEGTRFLDELWYKDLVEHLTQIRDLTLAAPVLPGPPAGKFVPIDVESFEGRLKFLDLPGSRSTVSAIKGFPATVARLWGAVGRAGIVHAGIAGWPIPLGWIAVPMARLRGKFVLTNVESAPWRTGFDKPRRARSFLRALTFETMARLCVNLSDIATFTHAGYLDTMLARGRKARGRVFNASWIDLKDVVSPDRAEANWQAKLADPARPLRVVFAANLTAGKGVPVLLRALEELDRRGVAATVDVYGNGVLQEDCDRAAEALKGSVTLRMRGMVAYGSPFFEMLDEHDVMVVPNVSDEQPRVVYDSFARALPVIASDNAGLLDCVTDGRDGKIVPQGDAPALADAIAWAAANRPRLREFGINALEKALSLTHDRMHALRAEFIASALEARRGRRGAVVTPGSSPSSRPSA